MTSLNCNQVGDTSSPYGVAVGIYNTYAGGTMGGITIENLNIINWALDERIPTAQVRTVLLALRINDCCRLPCPLTPGEPLPPTSCDCSFSI